MADIFNNEKRSEIMRKVKSKKNKSTELRLIDIFKQNGITGWKRNYPVKGHPDFVFLKEKVAVFVVSDRQFCDLIRGIEITAVCLFIFYVHFGYFVRKGIIICKCPCTA